MIDAERLRATGTRLLGAGRPSLDTVHGLIMIDQAASSKLCG